jgi:hypothetical protein
MAIIAAFLLYHNLCLFLETRASSGVGNCPNAHPRSRVLTSNRDTFGGKHVDLDPTGTTEYQPAMITADIDCTIILAKLIRSHNCDAVPIRPTP